MHIGCETNVGNFDHFTHEWFDLSYVFPFQTDQIKFVKLTTLAERGTHQKQVEGPPGFLFLKDDRVYF